MSMHLVTGFEQGVEDNTIVTLVRRSDGEANGDVMAYVAQMINRDLRNFHCVELTPVTRSSCWVKLYYNKT